MKTYMSLVVAGAFCFHTVSADAQIGGRPGGPSFGGSTGKLFGDNSAFTAILEMETKGGPTDDTMSLPGTLAFDQGKSRFEMDLSRMQGAKMPPGAAAQMKAMGMEKMITISRPDKKASYMVYPGLQAYAEMPMQDSQADTKPEDFKIESTELGKEKLDGHPCVKNKTVVTDKDGNKHESTVWNATDLKNFPIKFETTEGGAQVTMHFKDVKLTKPESSQFDAPSGFTKYDNMMTMMQQAMMKRLGRDQAPPRPGE